MVLSLLCVGYCGGDGPGGGKGHVVSVCKSSCRPGPGRPCHDQESTHVRTTSLVLKSVTLLDYAYLCLTIPYKTLTIVFTALSHKNVVSCASGTRVKVVLKVVTLITTVKLCTSILKCTVRRCKDVSKFLGTCSSVRNVSCGRLVGRFVTGWGSYYVYVTVLW